MGDKPNIDLGKGTLYIKHPDDKEYVVLGDNVICATIEPDEFADEKVPMFNMLVPQEVELEASIYVNELSFHSKVIIFGLWNAIKLTIKNIFKRNTKE